MSREYDIYLEQHKDNVRKGFEWLKVNLPQLLNCSKSIDDLEDQICCNHDASKSLPDEYVAYDRYFYGGNRSHDVVANFRYAWLMHIHRNPHHWQFYVLMNDEPGEGVIALDMRYDHILEMICDWWAFSWKEGNLFEIFKWYDEHKDYMRLSPKTRKTVEDILKKIKAELEKESIDHDE